MLGISTIVSNIFDGWSRYLHRTEIVGRVQGTFARDHLYDRLPARPPSNQLYDGPNFLPMIFLYDQPYEPN